MSQMEEAGMAKRDADECAAILKDLAFLES